MFNNHVLSRTIHILSTENNTQNIHMYISHITIPVHIVNFMFIVYSCW